MPSQNNNNKSRNWVFTKNNYAEEDVERFLSDAFRATPEVKYIGFSKEVAPTTGTPHLQGYICFGNAQRFNTVRTKLGGCHLEPMRGRIDQSEAYCKKGQAVEQERWFEAGEAPMTQQQKGEGEKRRWADFTAAAKEGRLSDIEESQPDLFVKYYNTMNRIHQDALKKKKLDDTTEKPLWLYGPAGTGKSRYARQTYPDAFLKMCNKWWDGYDVTRHEVAIIEDFDRCHGVLCHHMKIWADRYAFPAEIKGGSIMIRPKLIIVTSNYSPEEIWATPSDLEPIKRRFKIIRFSGNGEQTVEE